MNEFKKILIEKWNLIFIGLIVVVAVVFVSSNIRAAYAAPGWNISLNWVDVNSTSSSTNYIWNSETYESNTVKLNVKYSNTNIGSEDIEAGSLTITVSGIGDANRTSNLEGVIGADKASSTEKKRDWSYTYNSLTNTYTFTNNKKIAANSNVDGSFELVWTLESRKTKNNYSKSIQATLMVPDEEDILSNTVTYYETRIKDTYTLGQRSERLYSPEGLNDGLNADDYIWVKYILTDSAKYNSLGLKSTAYYQFTLPEGAILVNPNVEAISGNTYRLAVGGTYKSIYVIYPKSIYEGEKITNTVDLYGTYYEDSEESLLDSNTITINLSNFSFQKYTGKIYYVYKSMYGSYNDEHECGNGSGFFNGSKIGTNLTTTISLTASTNVDYNSNYNVYISDNDLKIKKADGTWQDLVDGDYEFTSVKIPANYSINNSNGINITPDSVLVEIYSNGSLVDTKYIKTTSQYVSLPSNTYNLEIKIKNITETSSIRFDVDLKFHIQDLSSVDTTNSAIKNTTNGYLYDENEKIIDESENSDSETVHVHERQNTYYNYTYLDYFYETTDGFTTYANISTYFQYMPGETLEKTGIYTLLPIGVNLPGDYNDIENIWDYVTLIGTDKNSILTSGYLARHATPKIIENYNGTGRTYIGFEFDFSDNPIIEPSRISVKIDLFLPGYNFQLYGSGYTLTGYSVIHDGDLQELEGKNLDSMDIDQDGNKNETISTGLSSKTKIYARSTYLEIVKYIKDSASINGYTTETKLTNLGSDYTYRLNAILGANIGRNIVITDMFETASGSEWQGTFDSIDTSYLDALKLNYEVAYTSDGTTFTTTIPEDKTAVKGIRVSVKDEVDAGTEMFVLVTMIAPADRSLVEKVAKNNYNITYIPVDSVSKEELEAVDLDSNITEVKLADFGTITVVKIDAITKETLPDVIFELYDSSNNLVGTYTTNSLGKITIKNIKYGTYTLKEISGISGYQKIDDITITLDCLNKVVEVENEHIKGTVELIKKNSLDENIGVGDAEYGLYTSEGTLINTYTTDSNGVITINNLEWDNYYLQEITAPNHFELNEEKIEFTINKDNCSETQTFTTTDNQSEGGVVKLTKYVKNVDGTKTDTRLKGATYNLYTSSGILVGQYVTDSNGEILVGDLVLNKTYYFEEKKAPKGYERSTEQIEFVATVDTIAEVTDYNQKKPGRIAVYKVDENNKVLSNVSFELQYYNESLSKYEKVATYRTDSNGSFTVENLEWGNYRLIEAKTQDGYVLDTTPIEFTIDNTNAGTITSNTRFIITNTRQSGSVKLTKTAEDGTTPVSGATYSLYKNDGSLVSSNLVTDDNGEINVTGLDWASYYFEETEAAPNYGLSNEKIRFSVSNLTAGTTQELTTTDPETSKSIILTKQIKISDINFEHGNPTFTFKISGTDMNGKQHTYYKQVTFTSDYVNSYKESNPDSDYVSMDVTLTNMTAGTYTVSEIATNRYAFESIENVLNGTISNETVTFDLEKYDEAKATFINNKNNQSNLSHNESNINILKSQKKMTTIAVIYDYEGELHHVDASTSLGENEHGPVIDRNHLKVVAVYDDGSEVVLGNNDYTLTATKGFSNDTIPESATLDYTITVNYVEDGITRHGYFSVTTDGNPDLVMPTLCEVIMNNGAGEGGEFITTDEGTIYITSDSPSNYVYYSGLLWSIVSIDPETCQMKMRAGTIAVISGNPKGQNYYDSDGAGNLSYAYQWLNNEFLNNLREPEKYIVMNYDGWRTYTTATASWNYETSQIEYTLTETKEHMVTASVGLLNQYEEYLVYNEPYENYSISSERYLAPTVILKSDVIEVGGTGDVNNPYIVKGELTEPLSGKVKLNTRYNGEYVTYGGILYRIVDKNDQGIKLITWSDVDLTSYLPNYYTNKSFDPTTYGNLGNFLNKWFTPYDWDNVDVIYYDAWHNSLSSDEQQMLVEDALWYIGEYKTDTGTHYNLAKCTDENCTEYASSVTATVGLPTVGEWFASSYGVTLTSPIVNIYSEESNYGILPVIYISNDTYITGGLGTKNSPFTLGI